MKKISEPKFVRCPDCQELSHVDDLLFYDIEISRDRKNGNRIIAFTADCGCDFCGNVWTIEEFNTDS